MMDQFGPRVRDRGRGALSVAAHIMESLIDQREAPCHVP